MTTATADEIVHDFKNPSFSGVGTSAHYLTVENQEKSRRDQVRDDIESALKAAEREAAERERAGIGTTLIEAQVERYLPHTSDDDDSIYRASSEIEEAKRRDPLVLLKDTLQKLGVLDDKENQIMLDEAKRIVNEATEEVENTKFPETSGFYEHVTSRFPKQSGDY